MKLGFFRFPEVNKNSLAYPSKMRSKFFVPFSDLYSEGYDGTV